MRLKRVFWGEGNIYAWLLWIRSGFIFIVKKEEGIQFRMRIMAPL